MLFARCAKRSGKRMHNLLSMLRPVLYTNPIKPKVSTNCGALLPNVQKTPSLSVVSVAAAAVTNPSIAADKGKIFQQKPHRKKNEEPHKSEGEIECRKSSVRSFPSKVMSTLSKQLSDDLGEDRKFSRVHLTISSAFFSPLFMTL